MGDETQTHKVGNTEENTIEEYKKLHLRELAIIGVAAVVLFAIAIFIDNQKNSASLAACNSATLSQALRSESGLSGTRVQMSSANSFRCENGFAVIDIKSETAPGSGDLSDLNSINLLFESQDGRWRRVSKQPGCPQGVPQNIAEIAC